MFSLNFSFKDKTKKITVPRNIKEDDLSTMIARSFKINENIAGFTNYKGQLITIKMIQKGP